MEIDSKQFKSDIRQRQFGKGKVEIQNRVLNCCQLRQRNRRAATRLSLSLSQPTPVAPQDADVGEQSVEAAQPPNLPPGYLHLLFISPNYAPGIRTPFAACRTHSSTHSKLTKGPSLD